jgi:murein DD-endopeptidase MepM/ murein hydrolase activator NlpD
MNPAQLDTDDIVSGKFVRAGEFLGKVGNYNNGERGTTYHLHFDMQVPTKVGWVFVNPYMTLVSAYERLIGARGSEIKDGDAVPTVAGVPPVIQHPSEIPAAGQAAAAQTEESPTVRAKQQKAKAKPHKKRRYVRKKRRHADD